MENENRQMTAEDILELIALYEPLDGFDEYKRYLAQQLERLTGTYPNEGHDRH